MQPPKTCHHKIIISYKWFPKQRESLLFNRTFGRVGIEKGDEGLTAHSNRRTGLDIDDASESAKVKSERVFDDYMREKDRMKR